MAAVVFETHRGIMAFGYIGARIASNAAAEHGILWWKWTIRESKFLRAFIRPRATPDFLYLAATELGLLHKP